MADRASAFLPEKSRESRGTAETMEKRFADYEEDIPKFAFVIRKGECRGFIEGKSRNIHPAQPHCFSERGQNVRGHAKDGREGLDNRIDE